MSWSQFLLWMRQLLPSVLATISISVVALETDSIEGDPLTIESASDLTMTVTDDLTVAADNLVVTDEGSIVADGGMVEGGLFGSGADGDLTCSGATTLTPGLEYDDVTIGAGCVLTVRGILRVNGTLNLTACSAGGIVTDVTNGNAASGTTAGASIAQTTYATEMGWLQGETGTAASAVAGGTAAGNTPNAAGDRTSTVSARGIGGAGGDGSGGVGGAGGAGVVYQVSDPYGGGVRWWAAGGITATRVVGLQGTPGGSGGGDGTAGGGSGTGGGAARSIVIFARSITTTGAAANCIRSLGGVGGAGGVPAGGNRGGGGGGGGGSGGTVWITTAGITGSASNAIDVTGGNGGAGGNGTGTGTGGTGGSSGVGGVVHIWNVTTGALSSYEGAASVAGAGPTGTTGGAGGVATVSRTALVSP